MNIEESIEIVKGKLLMIKKLLKNDEEDGHSSSYEMQTEDFEAIETLLTAYEKEKNKELESDIQQKNFEIKCLNSEIKNMYCEEGVIAILEDNFGLSRDEAISILEEE